MSESFIVPVSVTLEGGSPAITCLDVGNSAFAEPFFHETIERARDATPVVIPGSELRAASTRSCQPAGFIFHMSRCGSTLVSQLLKEIGGVRVYSEPPAINQALHLTSRLPRRRVRALVEALIRAFCVPATRVFFKFSSWNILEYRLFDELFPNVPKLFVVRRPAEVLASIDRVPPGFIVDRQTFAAVVRSRAGDRAGALDDLEFAAVLLSVFLDAMAAAGNRSTLVLDYADLPTAVWRMLPAFFGFAVDEIEVARMKRASRFHAKSWPPRIRFEKDEPPATLLERHVAAWIGSRYDDLLASRTVVSRTGA